MNNVALPIVVSVEAEMIGLASPNDAEFLQRFFKTGPAQYGEGDKFLGVRNPETRKIAKKYYKTVSNKIIKQLLSSEWHEVRLCALVMMNKIMTYKQTTENRKRQIYNMYLENISSSVNNWDLVDISAPHVVGEYLVDKPEREILKQLADGDLWQKRVSIISTFAFIRLNDFQQSIYLCKKLMYEDHDLLQKAVGWTMRELGKKNEVILLKMLDEYARDMPRTALRYSIEKLSTEKKYHYMNMKNSTAA